FKGDRVYGERFIGFRDGWRGVVEGDAMELERRDVQGIAKQGGTILGTSRTNVCEGDPTASRARATLELVDIDALLVIGGEGTRAGAHALAELGVDIVGVPKTIDNDISETDVTFGFDSAVGIATEAFDRLRTTGDSHGRAMVAEVMGR